MSACSSCVAMSRSVFICQWRSRTRQLPVRASYLSISVNFEARRKLLDFVRGCGLIGETVHSSRNNYRHWAIAGYLVEVGLAWLCLVCIYPEVVLTGGRRGGGGWSKLGSSSLSLERSARACSSGSRTGPSGSGSY